jgi:hypothetical protein
MSTLWDTFREGGFMNWILLLLGLVGAMAAFVAFILAAMRSRAALAVGAVVLLFGALIAGLGLMGMSMGRRSVENAMAGEAISAGMKERIRRAGYAESLSCVKFGLGFSALPILAGALAMLLGALRRSEDSEPGAPRADAASPGSAPPSPGGPSQKPSFALPAVALGVAGLIVVADFVALATPLPGRAIDEDDKGSVLLAAKEAIDKGDLEIGCEDLERALHDDDPLARGAGAVSPSAAPDFPKLAEQCVDFALKEALAAPPEDRRVELVRLDLSKLPKTEAQQKKIKAELRSTEEASAADPSNKDPLDDELGGGEGAGDHAAVEPSEGRPSAAAASGSAAAAAGSATAAAKPAAPPKVSTGSPTVSGRLPPEIIRRIVRQNFGRFRLCYENGLKNNPNLQGRVNVRFVIARDGSVSNVGNAGSDLPDSGVVSCVVRAFYGLSFPQPEGGIVTVVYPITFASS